VPAKETKPTPKPKVIKDIEDKLRPPTPRAGSFESTNP